MWTLWLIGWCLIGVLRVALFLLRSPRDSARAIAAARRALKSYRSEPPTGMTRLSEGLFSLATDSNPPDPDQPTVIYFTGTGETPHAPVLALRRLLAASEAQSARVFVVEAPSGSGAYYGSSAFSARIWQRLTQLLQREPGPFVLIGFSRGALAALDMGARIAEEQAKVASVLAFSPPLETPVTWPPTIVGISRFEELLERIERARPHVPKVLARFLGWVIERVHLVFTALVHFELDMHEDPGLTLALYDLRQSDSLTCAMRSAREFRLLLEAHTRELELFARNIAGVARRSQRFAASIVWGEADIWAPAVASKARMEGALAREQTPPERISLTMLKGRGHGLFREIHAPLTPLVSELVSVWHKARQMSSAEHERRHRQRTLERTLRESERPARADD